MIKNPLHVTRVSSTEEYFTEDYDRVHCKHGQYIGYPGGPDYMCHYCEMGYDRIAHYPELTIYITVGNYPEIKLESLPFTFALLDKWDTMMVSCYNLSKENRIPVSFRVECYNRPYWTN